MTLLWFSFCVLSAHFEPRILNTLKYLYCALRIPIPVSRIVHHWFLEQVLCKRHDVPLEPCCFIDAGSVATFQEALQVSCTIDTPDARISVWLLWWAPECHSTGMNWWTSCC